MAGESDYESSSLDDLLNAGATGLGAIGELLDKPGRAVRGLLSGRPREALAAIPLSDTLGLTKPNQAVSGAELLDTYGLGQPQGQREGVPGYMGLGLEIATDPLNYLAPAATAVGRRAANARKTASAADIERGVLTRMPEGRVARKAGYDYKQSQLDELAGQLRKPGDMGDFRTENLYRDGSLAGAGVEEAIPGLEARLRKQLEAEPPVATFDPVESNPFVVDLPAVPNTAEEFNALKSAGQKVEPGNYAFSDFKGGYKRAEVSPYEIFENQFSDLPIGESQQAFQRVQSTAGKIVDVPNPVPATPLQTGIRVSATPFGMFTGGRTFELGGANNAFSKGFRRAENFIDPLIDTAVDYVKKSPPIVAASRLLDPAVNEARTAEHQASMRARQPQAELLGVEARMGGEEMRQRLAKYPELAGVPEGQLNELILQAKENAKDARYKMPETNAEYMAQLARKPAHGPDAANYAHRLDQLQKIGEPLADVEKIGPAIRKEAAISKATQDAEIAKNRAAGVSANELISTQVEHSSRQPLILPREKGAAKKENVFQWGGRVLKNAFTTKSETQLSRAEATRERATGLVEDLARDRRFSGQQRTMQPAVGSPGEFDPKEIAKFNKMAQDSIEAELKGEKGYTAVKGRKQAVDAAKGGLEFEVAPKLPERPKAPAPEARPEDLGGIFGENARPAAGGKAAMPAAPEGAKEAASYADVRERLLSGKLEQQQQINTPKPADPRMPETIKSNTSYIVPVDGISVDPRRMQTRTAFNRSSGSANTLADVEAFNQSAAKEIYVWRDPATGADILVDGHNRLAKAKEAGVDQVTVKYIDAADEAGARAYGALRNVMDGTARPMDAGAAFRALGIGVEEARKAGMRMGSEATEKGLAFAKLDPEIWQMMLDGKGGITQDIGYYVGKYIPEFRDQRKFLMDLPKGLPASQVETRAALSGIAGGREVPAKGMFADDVEVESFTNAYADLAGAVKGEVAKDRVTFTALNKQKGKGRAKDAGNVLNESENARLAREYVQAEEAFIKELKSKSPLNDAIKEFLPAYQDATNLVGKAEREAAQKKVIDELLPRAVEAMRKVDTSAASALEKSAGTVAKAAPADSLTEMLDAGKPTTAKAGHAKEITLKEQAAKEEAFGLTKDGKEVIPPKTMSEKGIESPNADVVTPAEEPFGKGAMHPEDVGTMRQAQKLARELADEFGFDLKEVEHKRRPNPNGTEGLAYQNEGRISIVARFRDGDKWWRKPNDPKSVLQTVIHEVAHLHKKDGTRGLMDGPAHRELERQMTEWAKSKGWDTYGAPQKTDRELRREGKAAASPVASPVADAVAGYTGLRQQITDGTITRAAVDAENAKLAGMSKQELLDVAKGINADAGFTKSTGRAEIEKQIRNSIESQWQQVQMARDGDIANVAKKPPTAAPAASGAAKPADDLLAGPTPPAGTPGASVASPASLTIDGKPYNLPKSVRELADEYHADPANKVYTRKVVDDLAKQFGGDGNLRFFVDESFAKKGMLAPKDERKLAAYVEALDRAGYEFKNIEISPTGVGGDVVPKSGAAQQPTVAPATPKATAPVSTDPLAVPQLPKQPDAAAAKTARAGQSLDEFLSGIPEDKAKYRKGVEKMIRDTPEVNEFSKSLASELGVKEVPVADLMTALRESEAGLTPKSIQAFNDFLDKMAEADKIAKDAKELRPRLADQTEEAINFGKFDKDAPKVQEKYIEKNQKARLGINAGIDTAINTLKKVNENEFAPKTGKFKQLDDLVNDLANGDPVARKTIKDRILQGAELGGDSRFLGVPNEIAEDIKFVSKNWNAPDAVKPIVQAFTEMTSFFKEHVTFPFPAFLTRNFMSELFNNARENKASKRSAEFTNKYLSGAELPELPGMPKGLPVSERRDWVGQQLYAHEVSDSRGLLVGDTASGEGALANQRPLGEKNAKLGTGTGTAAGAFKTSIRKAADAIENPSSWKRPVEAFENYKNFMKAMNAEADAYARTAHFVEGLYQGLSPADSAASVHRVHARYDKSTPFEKSVLKNVIPFYTYSRQALPSVLEDLATSAKFRTAVRATTSDSLSDGFTPDWIGEGTHIGLPGAPEGKQRFATGLGLPFEEPFLQSLGSLAGGNFKRAAQATASSFNPLIQFPIQETTGTQLFSGRKLDDIRPSAIAGAVGGGLEDLTGLDLPVSLAGRIVGASPFGRMQGTADRLFNSDSGLAASLLNVGTGVSLRDIDPKYEQQKELQRALEARLKESGKVKTAERLYVPDSKKGTLTEKEDDLFSAYKGVQDDRRKASAKRKKEAGDK
jgi:hypothetical protein